ncbi:MAG: hypothetical protein Q8K32_35785 [Archangium sp.]|nr:hypothetical protein [Archangium sp.]
MRLVLLLGLLSTAASGQSSLGGIGSPGGRRTPAPSTVLPDGGLTLFAEELARLAGEGWAMFQDGDSVTLSTEVLVMPMNAAFESDRERRTFSLTVTVHPFLEEATQRALLAKELKRERAAWKTVEKLECDGMEFNDHYLDGLCFRARNDVQERRVTAYREARERWLNVPRFHRGRAFAVRLRGGHPELTDGPCQPCVALEKKVAAVLTAYP